MPGGSRTQDERLSDLESHFMHIEKLQEQLNEVVIEQQGQIERLTRALDALREQVRSGGPATSEEDGGEEAPPPHY